MLARIRAAQDGERGFTLIELLVVVIIIGILAGIAIPVFFNQRKKGVDSAMKADLRTVANAEESAFTDTQTYAAVGPSNTVTIGGEAITLSDGNSAQVLLGTTTANAGAYCVTMTRASGAAKASRDQWVYKSNAGGIQTATNATCSGF